MIFLLVIIYLSFVGLGVATSLIGSAWPAMYEVFGVAITSAGIVQMMITGGAIISSFFAGKIIKKIGFVTTAITTVITIAITLLAISFSQSFLFLCLWAIPLGMATGLLDATINSYVAIHYQAKQIGRAHV